MPIDSGVLQTALSARYEIERELGSGRMAVLYLGRDLRLDRRVAIKVLRPDVAVSLGAKRFLREIDIAAHLTHPHILGLHDSGEAAGYLYYVMPYIEGETLRERLDRERILPVEEACQIAAQVGDALDYAHGQGVIHRDVKPENILLSGGHAFVADFGLARALEESGGERLTQTGIVIGTPEYGSPEQSGADGPVDGRSDEYSLATVVYEMLTGDPPFAGASIRAIMARKTTQTPSNPRLLRDSIPPRVEAAVMKALAKLPADRYRTTGEFCAALTGGPFPAMAPSPDTAKAPSFWSELKRRHVYHTAAVYAAVAWLLVEVSATTFPYLNLPGSAVTFLIALAILGFPVALVLAWAYEITRDGIRRT
jgi:serine/threonine-protein kinase